jgi:hypothetical protein
MTLAEHDTINLHIMRKSDFSRLIAKVKLRRSKIGHKNLGYVCYKKFATKAVCWLQSGRRCDCEDCAIGPSMVAGVTEKQTCSIEVG